MKFLTEFSGPNFPQSLPENWIFERIEEWSKRSPDRLAFAVDHPDRTEEYSYTDVLNQSRSIAAGLAARNIQPGDRVGILMENIPQWVFALLGILRAGAIAVPLPTTLPEDPIRRIVDHSGCKLLFADAPNLEKASVVAAAFNREIVAVNGAHPGTIPWTRFQILNPKPETRIPTNPDSTALIIYTSGTTGDPKGVQLTVSNLAHEIAAILDGFAISSDHRILSVLPFSHVLPLIANGIGPLCVGAGVVFLSSISPQRITEAFKKHRISLFICVPQFFYVLHKRIFAQVNAQPWILRLLFSVMMRFSRLVNNTGLSRRMFARIHKTISPSLTTLASGGSNFDIRIAQDLSDLGYTMLQAYGLTETCAAATATPPNANRIGSVGKPIRGVTLRIDSPKPDGIGEICIRGPIIMKGYFHDDKKTAEVIRDGWFYSGDLGFIHRDGSLVITGRSKDVIVLASGKNIYPEEIEAHYEKSEFIKELCVLGVAEEADGPKGERLHAIVVPDMDEFRRRGQTVIREMVRFEMENLSKQLPSYQRVLSFSIRNEPLPRTVTRKLKRFEIQQEAQHEKTSADPVAAVDDPIFTEGTGAIVAELIRAAKPSVGALDPSMNLELDLGFDSLGRVELLGLLENRLGAHIDEERAARLYTLAELLEALGTSQASGAAVGRGWNEIVHVGPDDELNQHYILKPNNVAFWIAYIILRKIQLLSRLFLRYHWSGIENLPASTPFILCPNHESFLDAPLLASVLPRYVLRELFSLGYSNYWDSAITSRFAEWCKIVAIDPNANLVRAMQVGAVGLKHKKVLLIFPEGTRTIDGRIGEFKKGAAILAYELGVPIVPVGIRGTFESWPRGGGFRLHSVEIVFGKPIDPQAFQNAPDPYAAITDRLKNEVKKLTLEGM